MKHVSFQNDGLIDLRAVKTFGASSKESKNPIGIFGTGLKYALAICLRHDCQVTIWRGLEEFVFTKTPTTIRVDEFDIITMNGEELAFTTNLGRTWEPWQAIRELWCNALDEDGDICGGQLDPAEGKTTIVITGQVMVDAYHLREDIMLLGEEKWFHEGVAIHYKKSNKAYFRGVRVNDLQKPAVLTYNVVAKGLVLTEDRTLAHPYLFNVYVRDAFAISDDEVLLRELLDAPKESFEASLDFSDADPGPCIMRMLEGEDFKSISNLSLLSMYRKKKGISLKPTDVVVDDNEQQQLLKALAFLKKIGYHVTDYPIHITDDLDDTVLGQAYEGAIYINRRCFMRGTKMVAGTILEEWVHLHHSLYDCTRAFQDYFVDALITMGEKMVGEPL